MGREVRMVPANWKHPKDARGYLPMHERFPYNAEEIKEGLRDGWLENKPPHYGVDVMPQWPKSKRTHYQMYETCSEGTPISPVMKTPEALARWLVSNEASAGASQIASYGAWLAMIKDGGHAPSMVSSPKTGLVSGVEAIYGGKKGSKRKD